jgi:hypothetical protein
MIERFFGEITKATLKGKILRALIMVFLIALSVFFLLRRMALWLEDNTFRTPDKVVEFSLKLNRPFWIEKRENTVETVTVYVGQEELDKIISESEKPELAKYICDKFGPAQCATALAVAKAESGMRCDALGINTNKTADLGVYQINTVHLKKGGSWTLANMGDCYKNVDLAYELWQQQGWEPWVAFWSGSYLVHLE